MKTALELAEEVYEKEKKEFEPRYPTLGHLLLCFESVRSKYCHSEPAWRMGANGITNDSGVWMCLMDNGVESIHALGSHEIADTPEAAAVKYYDDAIRAFARNEVIEAKTLY